MSRAASELGILASSVPETSGEARFGCNAGHSPQDGEPARRVGVWSRAFAAGLVLVLVLALAGCGAGGRRELQVRSLARLVLQPADLRASFVRFDEGRLLRADAHPGPREDPGRFGREGGWKARYKASGSAPARGPLVVESRVDLFGGEEGARRDLDAYRAEFAAAGLAQLPAPSLGAAAVAVTVRQGSGKTALRFFTIAWRDRNATASVLVEGFDGRVSLRDAAKLAARQQRRLASARGDG